MIHAIIAIAVTILCYLFGLHVYASLAIACFYVGREHAQAEQRGIRKYHRNKRVNAPL